MEGPPSDLTLSSADRLWDVAIIGAGPAGSTSAIHLSRRGHKVILIDKEGFPRDKVCGDGLIADALRSLKGMGLYDEVRGKGHSSSFCSIYSPSRINFDLAGEFLTIKRFILDEILVRKAIETGAAFLKGKAINIEQCAGGEVRLSIQGMKKSIRSRIALIATGASVDLAAKLGLVIDQGPSAVALRCYVHSPVKLDHLVISYDRSITPGYAWVFPLGSDEFNIGCGVFYRGSSKTGINLRETFRAFTSSFPLAAEIIRRSTCVTPLRGAMLRCGLRVPAGGGAANVLSIGETIGATFPFTGEGIGKAMETGELAAQVSHTALETGDTEHLREFARLLEQQLRPKFLGYQIAEDWLSKPWLNDFVARRIIKSTFLKEMVTGILNETVDPREVFSLRSMILSFLR